MTHNRARPILPSSKSIFLTIKKEINWINKHTINNVTILLAIMSLNRLKEMVLGIKSVHEDIHTYLAALNDMGLNHLHFGYWTDGMNKDDIYNFGSAGDNLYHLIKSHIPPEVKNILDVGGGIGATSDLLTKDGYSARCIVPDKILIREGQKRFPMIRFLQGTAELFHCSPKYDLAVLIESYQYITHRFKALKNIGNQLTNNSYIIILDEFSLGRLRELPQESELDSFLNQTGYFIKNRLDITREVLPTCDVIASYFKSRNEKVVQQWEKVKSQYLRGKRCYLFLMYGKNNTPAKSAKK